MNKVICDCTACIFNNGDYSCERKSVLIICDENNNMVPSCADFLQKEINIINKQ